MNSHDCPRPLVRDAAPGDFDAIARIYSHYVEHALATFEEIAPSVDDMRARHAAIAAAGLPYLVAELDGRLAGYAYASAYRPRSAYRHTIEDSVYVAEGSGRSGIGFALLTALIERCERGPWRQMIAVIGNSGNAGSIALHARLGFEHVGVLRDVGFKHGRWVDTVLMQRALNTASDAAA
ncbi:N-acetyltransferase family protein [Caballeronia novacaledonica]|uniref:GNAT family N-acetyltransferase n=1 Tax=Caballeronia novacaledonica TaxID=1544861 RepID=UPI001EE37ED3|nr:GNAT family N-acetyltransferase [Caballeronia novacaledonica]GJH08676.1 N-acetyltransferase family protein [Caballeronia novacaledonica]